MFLPSQVLWHLTALIKHVPKPDKTSFWWVIQAPGVSLANFNPRLIPDAEVPVCLEPVSGFIEYLQCSALAKSVSVRARQNLKVFFLAERDQEKMKVLMSFSIFFVNSIGLYLSHLRGRLEKCGLESSQLEENQN